VGTIGLQRDMTGFNRIDDDDDDDDDTGA